MINSLGIKKSPKDTKVVVAMSGGVDSSVVAALMKDEGYNVTGITLKLYDDAKPSKYGRQCCAGQDIVDAKRVSEKLNIEHKILFYQKNIISTSVGRYNTLHRRERVDNITINFRQQRRKTNRPIVNTRATIHLIGPYRN